MIIIVQGFRIFTITYWTGLLHVSSRAISMEQGFRIYIVTYWTGFLHFFYKGDKHGTGFMDILLYKCELNRLSGYS